MLGSDHVEANSELQNKIQSIQEERSGNQAELEEKEREIQALEREMEKLDSELRTIDHETTVTNQKIREKDEEIENTKEAIEQLVEEIHVLEERIAERDELLNSRVRSMYKNGGSVNFMEVILGARSFGDLINRITALNTIAQQDRNILEAHHNDKNELEEIKQEVENQLITLEDQMVELEQLKEKLVEQSKEKGRILDRLELQEGQLSAELGDLEGADQILAAQEKAIQQELAAWERRQRELEEQRKREEERRKQEQQASSNNNNSTPTDTSGSIFMRPTTGAITSPYGPRWGRFHHGIDIGKGGRSGDVHVVAAEAGTVIRSYYSASYGNTVMISHNVNGQVVTTLYAHLENRFVSDGQRVERGQLLGYMGNTGRSFGPHLHFEVHEGPWNVAKSNSVNPMNYIPN